MTLVHGEPSFTLTTPELTLCVTARGGHVAPVTFHLPGRDVSPYALAPWEPAEFTELPPLLSVLRGDFFCIPFGVQDDGPPHGETANHEWSLTDSNDRSLTLHQRSSARVNKILSTRIGHHAVYSEHQISNIEGDFNYGNHPIIDLSNLSEGAGRISTSPFRWASVFPGAFANPTEGETQALAEGTRFDDLRRVKLTSGGTTDLTRYPSRAGNEDLVMLVNEPATPTQPFAWSAAVLDGYLWFSLKNPSDFPATLLWISNGGRTAPPWNGRHLGRIGIEEVCSHFCNGIAISRQNLLAAEGIPTSRRFKREETVSLRIVQAVALTPEGFGVVTEITPLGEDSVTITDESGHQVVVAVDWKFVL